MKNKLILLITSFFLFFGTNSYSSPINKINFIGLNNSSEDALLNGIPFEAGQEFSDTSSNGIIQSLFETGLFSDITLKQNGNELDIILIENPIIRYFKGRVQRYIYYFFK